MEKGAEPIRSIAIPIAQDFCAEVRDELDDYRDAINQNTDELGSCYDYVQTLERKIDRLAERLEELAALVGETKRKEVQSSPSLNEREKRVFGALYGLLTGNAWTSLKVLSQKLSVSESQVNSVLVHMANKGVPVRRKFTQGSSFVGLDQKFKDAQTRKNMLGVATPLTYWMQ